MIIALVLGIAVVLATLLVIAGWLIGTYNTFVGARQDLREQWSNIKTEYQRRADMILNLVETAKGTMRFEKKTLVKISQARAGYFGDTKKEQIKNLGKMNTLFANLMGRIEAYPELKSIGVMQSVLDNIRETENRINIARTDYNETVRDYNVLVNEFPGHVLAGMFGFVTEEYFESEESAKKAPMVSFAEEPERQVKNKQKKSAKKKH